MIPSSSSGKSQPAEHVSSFEKGDGWLSQWILSRKISIKSMTRHFAGWKLRHFHLLLSQGVLQIHNPGKDHGTIINLSLPSVSIGRHYYAVDSYQWLWLKYYDQADKCPKEIIMKFEEESQLITWEKMLSDVIERYRHHIKEHSLQFLDIVTDFLQEQSKVQQTIINDDNVMEGGGYFTHPESDHDRLDDDFNSFSIMDGFNSDPSPSSMPQDDFSEFFSQMTQETSPEKQSKVPKDASFPHNHRLHMDSKAFKSTKRLKSLVVPKMNILIMAVGTRGDIQPFAQFGLRLQQDGHRVRLATHASFRSYVLEKGLEYYPLAGDPVVLSEFMVKTQGFIVPTSSDLLLEAPKHHAMIVEIINSCWGACIDPDPQDEDAKLFVADAIISNPVTYAHIHCAEALGIPLHLMFPQPWLPTKAFPHPLACMSYQRTWCAENYLSYQMVDRTLWLSFEREINKFRVQRLGLEPLRAGQGGWNLTNYHQVPFVKMWSPSLVPKPKDWPDYVDIVGSFLDPIPAALAQQPQATTTFAGNTTEEINIDTKKKSNNKYRINSKMNSSYDPRVRKTKSEDSILPVKTDHYEPSPQLAQFLHLTPSSPEDIEENVIFVGFGSMVVKDLESIISLFLEGAALANVKILIQVGWTAITPERFFELAIEAQDKAAKVRQVEEMASSVMGESLIFPKAPAAKEVINRDRNATLQRLEHDAIQSDTDMQPSVVESEDDGNASRQSFGNWIAGAAWTIGSRLATSVTGNTANTTASSAMSKSTISAFQNTKSEPLTFEDDDTWDKIDYSGWTASKHAFFMGPCPHNWLFQHVSAIVHHGGAGTTAAGLRFGKPTWICPFFGDQFFWGEMVHRANVGPKPCPITQLDLQIVVNGFELLTNPKTLEAAKAMAISMSREDGIESAVHAFYRHLPLEQMLCDISLFQNDYQLAHVYCADCKLKMTSEVSKQIHEDPSLHLQGHHILPCCYVDWATPRPTNAKEALLHGFGGLVHEFTEGVVEAVYDPVKGIYDDGLTGAATGLVTGINHLVAHNLTGGAVLYDRLREGLITTYHKATEKNVGHLEDQVEGQEIETHANEMKQVALYRKKINIPNHSIKSDVMLQNRTKRMNILASLKSDFSLQQSLLVDSKQPQLNLECSNVSALTDEHYEESPRFPTVMGNNRFQLEHVRQGNHKGANLSETVQEAEEIGHHAKLNNAVDILSPIDEEENTDPLPSPLVQEDLPFAFLVHHGDDPEFTDPLPPAGIMTKSMLANSSPSSVFKSVHIEHALFSIPDPYRENGENTQLLTMNADLNAKPTDLEGDAEEMMLPFAINNLTLDDFDDGQMAFLPENKSYKDMMLAWSKGDHRSVGSHEFEPDPPIGSPVRIGSKQSMSREFLLSPGGGIIISQPSPGAFPFMLAPSNHFNDDADGRVKSETPPPTSSLMEELTRSMMIPHVRSTDVFDETNESRVSFPEDMLLETESIIIDNYSVKSGSLHKSSVLLNSTSEHSSVCTPLPKRSLPEAYGLAIDCMRVFTGLCLKNEKFISERNFYRLVQRALAREMAIHSDEHPNPRLQVLSKFSKEECEAMLQSLLKVLTRNKRYLHFVDFARLYLDVVIQSSPHEDMYIDRL